MFGPSFRRLDAPPFFSSFLHPFSAGPANPDSTRIIGFFFLKAQSLSELVCLLFVENAYSPFPSTDDPIPSSGRFFLEMLRIPCKRYGSPVSGPFFLFPRARSHTLPLGSFHLFQRSALLSNRNMDSTRSNTLRSAHSTSSSFSDPSTVPRNSSAITSFCESNYLLFTALASDNCAFVPLLPSPASPFSVLFFFK